ncbi:MAG: hypothetical protein AAFU54_02440 [Chloroflexota bacterium]
MKEVIPVVTTRASQIYWHDADQSILVHHVNGAWDWPDARFSIGMVNDILREHDRDVYTIHHFEGEGARLPRTNSLLTVRHLVAPDPPNEKVVIFLNAPQVLRRFIGVAASVYRLAQIEPKYVYVNSMIEALHVIEQRRSRV